MPGGFEFDCVGNPVRIFRSLSEPFLRCQRARRVTFQIDRRAGLQRAMPAGAARNALDCALWDLAAKRAGQPAYTLAGLPAPGPVTTAYTISLAEPAVMAQATERAAHRALLKVKLGADGDPARIRAVRAAAPKATLIVDANEGWTNSNLVANLDACAHAGVALVEQPLPDGRDDVPVGPHRR